MQSIDKLQATTSALADVNNTAPTISIDFTSIRSKTVLISPTEEQFELLKKQIQNRIDDSRGETIYDVGIGEDGGDNGLDTEEYAASLATLQSLAATLDADCVELRQRKSEKGMTGQYLVRRRVDQTDFMEIRVAVVGNVDAGKSTLLGVLTHSELDNGRGHARQRLFRHKHEMESGRTSSVGNDILGFDSVGNVINKPDHGTLDWVKICEKSAKVITFIDLAGHERYLKTTVFGMTGHAPDFGMLMIGANAGIVGMTKEHLGLALALSVPVFVVDLFQRLPKMRKMFIKKPQTIYAGFDPTADSLHIGNLLVIMGLIHCQRGGHQPIALLGGATGQIGDPSGRKTERKRTASSDLDKNLKSIQQQIETLFDNHERYFWKKNPEAPELKKIIVVNNADWYRDMNLVDFIANIGRHFRLGDMLSRSIVQSRLKNDAGMSFTEFTYQIFQAYDWLHLCKTYDCLFQLGGSDQMGNLWGGHELISRAIDKSVYGLTLPIITNEEGDKFGKSAGNAVWLKDEKTSPFSFYQFFVRIADSEVENLLKLLTLLPLKEINEIMTSHRQTPELREAQVRLAKEITLLVHGESGLAKAEEVSAALYSGSVEALGKLTHNEIKDSFAGASMCELLLAPGMTLLEVAMECKCFATKKDAIRIIDAGGFYVNQNRAKNISEVISPAVHILENGLTLLRVGKRNYYIVTWLK